nr:MULTISPECIES: recombinase family protein [unclassified Modicisalibacter]
MKASLHAFDDTISGAKADRQDLTAALDFLRDGDVLVMWRLDRLGRSLPHLIEVVSELETRIIGFQSLTDNIDMYSDGIRLTHAPVGSL